MAAANSIEPLDDMKEFAAADWAGGDIDLVAASPDGHTPARYLEVVDIGSGSLVVRTYVSARLDTPVDRSFTCVTNGEKLICKLTAIDDTSDVARVRVGW